MKILRSWKIRVGRIEDSIAVTAEQVIVGHEEGFGHGSSGISCSLKEFLEGRLDSIIEQIFGQKTLCEVAAFVKELEVKNFQSTSECNAGVPRRKWWQFGG